MTRQCWYAYDTHLGDNRMTTVVFYKVMDAAYGGFVE